MNDVINNLALRHPCPYCGSHGRCVTKSGGRATWLHVARTDDLREAWTAGYLAAEEDQKRIRRAWAS